jgi:selenocysteine-specific translation elongation factor
MANLNVAVLGPAGYAKIIAKAGTTSDLTFYNLKKGEDTVTFIEPSRYPERLAPLFFAVSAADEALLVIDEITPVFGEMLVMLHACDVRKGYIVLRNYLDPSRIRPLLRGTVAENYAYIEENEIDMRERFLNDASAKSVDPGTSSSGVVAIDHSFNVKGIGTVILGSVMRGVIRRHDILNVLPGKKTAQIRSIQKHDDDFDDATAGDRVGLALKNIESDALDRGDVMTNDRTVRTSAEIRGRAELVPYWQIPFKAGMVLHIGHWMQFISGRVDAVEDDGDWRRPVLSIHLDRELVTIPGDRAVLHHLDAGKLRVAGTIEIR